MYKNLLVPTDGSDGSHAAARVGIGLATNFGAQIHALFVIDERFVAGEFDMAVEAAEREAETGLDRVEQEANGAPVAVEKHLRRGIPHEEILGAIDEYGADLVVMGTNGRTGVDRLVHLGSVTERVVRASPVEVLTVPIRTADRAPEH